MNGQWIGQYSGDANGCTVFDIDDVGNHYEGWGYIYENSNDIASMPSGFFQIKTSFKQGPHVIFTVLLDINTAMPIFSKSNIALSDIASSTIELCIQEKENELKIQWKTGAGISGKANFKKSQANKKTQYEPVSEVRTWQEFKEYVRSLEFRRFLYRGQNELKRLRTSFHRTGRADLERFLREDIQCLHRQMSARTTHVFNLDNSNENGAFFNLVQHHGYPTPLLDWTYSPYVSAFFAYRRIANSKSKEALKNDKVRIFIFDQQEWKSKVISKSKLTRDGHHFSILEFIAINNERMIPQQAVSSVTNIDDIESYIRNRETRDTKFLRIIDLPYNERSYVMRELSSMGITAGSLFPGFDGTCEDVKERFFFS